MMDRTSESMLCRLARSKYLQRLMLFVVITASALLYAGLKTLHVLDVPIHYFENQAFQLRSTFIRPPDIMNNIAVIDVDDETLWRIRRAWPFPNGVQADFLRQLSQYNPSMIVMNFMFVNKSDPNEKRALEDVIRDAGNVILANRLTVTGNHIVQDPEIEEVALDSGIISKPREKDNSLRRTYTYFSSEKKPLDILSSELVTLMHDEKMDQNAFKLDGKYFSIPDSKARGRVFLLPITEFQT